MSDDEQVDTPTTLAGFHRLTDCHRTQDASGKMLEWADKALVMIHRDGGYTAKEEAVFHDNRVRVFTLSRPAQLCSSRSNSGNRASFTAPHIW